MIPDLALWSSSMGVASSELAEHFRPHPHRLFEESSTFAAFALEIDDGDDGEDSMPKLLKLLVIRADRSGYSQSRLLSEGRVAVWSCHHNTPR